MDINGKKLADITVAEFLQLVEENGMRIIISGYGEKSPESAENPLIDWDGPIKKEDLVHVVTSYLHILGISPSLKGYNYIRTSILFAMEDNGIKGLHTKIAKKYGCTLTTVEHAIHFAVCSSMVKGDPEIIARLFGNIINSQKLQPTNREFIATIVDHLKLRLVE